ncbi:MAG: hypothetical protein IJW45_00320 [Oscillospiraceae bacterium]|nr:hypothetical protein [Oscillospiraceae bacterium]
MFGFVCASVSELDEAQRARYDAVYCGICRAIRVRHSQVARLGLSYDMAFLALLHMSLYEPQETAGDRACMLHPFKPRAWLDCESIRYAADMNVALSYYKCLDDWNDDRKLSAKVMARSLRKRMPGLEAQYPRQCGAIRDCIRELSELEGQQCREVDLLAGCFGRLMGEILVLREDHWAPRLRQVGFYLGRAIYLADAIADYEKDKKEGNFNPLPGEDPAVWEGYLTMALGRCTQVYQQLPLVQDKQILDNILYSGFWVSLRRSRHEEEKG